MSHHYLKFLYPLKKQKEVLIQLNEKMPDEMRAPSEWLNDLDTISDHKQTFWNLECFYVEFGNPDQTVKYYWKMIELAQNVVHPCAFSTNQEYLRSVQGYKKFERGVHRININLLANWSRHDGRSIDEVREYNAVNNDSLAAAEVMAAYVAQHPILISKLDGISLPHVDMAGYTQGINHDYVPYLGYSTYLGMPFLESYPSDEVHKICSAPTIIKC